MVLVGRRKRGRTSGASFEPQASSRSPTVTGIMVENREFWKTRNRNFQFLWCWMPERERRRRPWKLQISKDTAEMALSGICPGEPDPCTPLAGEGDGSDVRLFPGSVVFGTHFAVDPLGPIRDSLQTKRGREILVLIYPQTQEEVKAYVTA